MSEKLKDEEIMKEEDRPSADEWLKTNGWITELPENAVRVSKRIEGKDVVLEIRVPRQLYCQDYGMMKTGKFAIERTTPPAE